MKTYFLHIDESKMFIDAFWTKEHEYVTEDVFTSKIDEVYLYFHNYDDKH